MLWLAKFSSRSDRFDIPGVECASLLLAQEAGLHVLPVRVEMLGDRRVMLIRRFDRYWMGQAEQLTQERPTGWRWGQVTAVLSTVWASSAA